MTLQVASEDYFMSFLEFVEGSGQHLLMRDVLSGKWVLVTVEDVKPKFFGSLWNRAILTVWAGEMDDFIKPFNMITFKYKYKDTDLDVEINGQAMGAFDINHSGSKDFPLHYMALEVRDKHYEEPEQTFRLETVPKDELLKYLVNPRPEMEHYLTK